jgi:hypothetical protein
MKGPTEGLWEGTVGKIRHERSFNDSQEENKGIMADSTP